MKEISVKIHMYFPVKEGETEEEAQKRVTNAIFELEEKEGCALQIHDIYSQEA